MFLFHQIFITLW